MSDLMNRIENGEVLIMDGAMGTELERRGVPFEGEAWSAKALVDHGDVVRDVHCDYLDAGAQIHIVNSFALGKHVLQAVGMGDQFIKLNRRSVELFDQAVATTDFERSGHYAAGSISTFAANSDRGLLPEKGELLRNCSEQAEVLVEAGVDLFALEMLFDVDVTQTMMRAVAPLGLPVVVGFTCDWSDQKPDSVISARGMGLPSVGLDEILPSIADSLVSVDAILAIMHSQFDVTDQALQVAKKYWHGPIAIYPNSGKFVNLHMQFDSVCGEDTFAEATKNWIGQGANIIGGCCGLGPGHIRRIAELIDTRSH